MRKSLLFLFAWLFAVAAHAQSLTPIAGGTTVNTTITIPSPQRAVGLYTLGNITTWNIKLPPNPPAGQVVNITCGGGSVTTLNLSVLDSSTITPSITTCASGANFFIQYVGGQNTWVQTIYGSSVTAGVSSITNVDGTLTISPTTGSVVASLSLIHANTWAAVQTFGAGDLALTGGGTGCAQFTANILSGTGTACAAGGSVTSVNAVGTGIFAFTGGPVTTSGSLTLTQTGTSGAIPYFSNGTTLSSSAALTANALVIGGGPGSAPAAIAAPSAAGDLFYFNGTTWSRLAGNTGATNYLQETAAGVPSWTSPVSGVSSVTNSDSSLTISPTTGAVVASLNTANNNTWSGIQTFGTIRVAVRSSSAATVTVSATTDYFLCLNPSTNAIAVSLPATPATGLTFLVKDCGGAAATHNITISPAAGNIDGSATYVLNTNYQSIALTYTGAAWSLN